MEMQKKQNIFYEEAAIVSTRPSDENGEKTKRRLKRMQAALVILIIFVVNGNAGAAQIISGWDRAKNPPSTNIFIRSSDIQATNINAFVSLSSTTGGNVTNDWAIASQGSGDGTFGTFSGAFLNDGSSTNGAYLSKVAGVYMDCTVQNTGSTAYDLDGFHFDVWRKFGTSGIPSVSVLVGGGITAGTLLFSTNGLTALGSAPPITGADYSDVDIPLSGLTDHTLAAGESVTFRILITGTQGSTFIDNVALTGTISTPPSLCLMIISSADLLGFRKFHR